MRKHSTTYTHRNAWLGRRGAFYAGMGALSLGFVLGCAGADFEGDESWEEAEYGQSEQALRRLVDVGGVGGIAVGELDPGNPEPPPPPPPPPPHVACEGNPNDDLIAALGYRVLRDFGRGDPGAWECVPGAPNCNQVRLSAAVRNASASPAHLAKVGKLDEFVRYMTDAGAMGTFAAAYQSSVARCAANPCNSVPLALEFVPGQPNACGDISITISHRGLNHGPLGDVLAQGGVLAQAGNSSPRSAAAFSKAPVADVALLNGGLQAAPRGGGTAADGGATARGTTTPLASRSASDVLGTFYGLYGHKGPCPDPNDGVCNARDTNTVIKTYLDDTCEGLGGSNPYDPADSCYKPAFDAAVPVFEHFVIGSGATASERDGEYCSYWGSAGSKAAGTLGQPRRIQKSATSVLFRCLLPR